ncbi:MAG: recombinase family protein [Muribaculum sp.]|nr:recombinase family protein [Muribaculum sp.]
MKHKAIILSRVSSEHQTLEQQTDAILKAVHNDGYTDDNIIIIEDIESAIKLSEEERNGLNKMKEYINNDPTINAVYIYELSRLSRRQLVLFSIRDFLIEHQVQLICLEPPLKLLNKDGKMGNDSSLMFSIYASISESEMRTKKERFMRGRYHNRKIGKIMSGFPPFGYSVNKEKYYIVNEEQSAIVRRFFSEYSKGDKSMADIAKELKEEGLFPNTSFDTLQENLGRWLNREFYCGNETYPQIISKSLFDKVQIERKKRKGKPRRSHKNRFMLKGLLFDVKSKRALSAFSGNDAYCISHIGGTTIKRWRIDPIVWDYAKKMYRKYLMNKTILQRKIQKDLLTIGKKLETVKSEIQTIKDKMDKVEERMIFGRLSEHKGAELLDKLSEQLTDKEKRQLELTNESIAKQQQLTDAALLEDINEDAMSLDEKIEIIRKVVKKLTIERPLKFTAHISIYNRINDMVAVYEVKGKNKTETTFIGEFNRKDKS